MGHRHSRSATIRTIAVAFAALALAGGCAARGAPSAGQAAASESVPTDDVTTPTPVPTVDQSTEQQGQSESDPAPDPQPPPDAGGGGGSGSGSGGGSGGGSENRAAGSPIDVPTVPDAHIQMDGLQDTIRDLFIRACGGTELCVTLKYQDGACFVGYAPTGRVPRWSEVTVLTESQDECDKPHNRGTDDSGSTDGSTDGTTDGSTDGSTDSGSGGGTTDQHTETAPVPSGTATGSEQTDGTGTG